MVEEGEREERLVVLLRARRRRVVDALRRKPPEGTEGRAGGGTATQRGVVIEWSEDRLFTTRRVTVECAEWRVAAGSNPSSSSAAPVASSS